MGRDGERDGCSDRVTDQNDSAIRVFVVNLGNELGDHAQRVR